MENLSTSPRQPLLILPEYAARLRPIPAPQREAYKAERREQAFQLIGASVADRERSQRPIRRGIGLLLLVGELSPDGDFLGTSINAFIRELGDFAANPDIGHIVLYIDSPGGTYAGCPEAAEAVAEANRIKPVTAYVGGYGLMCSGAYWIGSAAGRIVATTSASDIGSIGCVVLHIESSRLLDKAGITATVIRAPEGKARGNSIEPLDDDTRQVLQEEVDGINSEFISAVMRQRISRTTLKAVIGLNGRTVRARQALALGLIDQITPWQQFIAYVQAETARERVAGAASMSPRLRAAKIAGLVRRGVIDAHSVPVEPSPAAVRNRLDQYLSSN